MHGLRALARDPFEPLIERRDTKTPSSSHLNSWNRSAASFGSQRPWVHSQKPCGFLGIEQGFEAIVGLDWLVNFVVGVPDKNWL